METGSEARRRWTGATLWILLVLASLVLIGYGIIRGGWSMWLPTPAEMEQSRTGSLFVYAGSAVSLAASVWSHARGNPVWVTVCAGLPGVLVGWAALVDPDSLLRHLAAVLSFPMALSAVAEVIWARGRQQRGAGPERKQKPR